jgi:hypothetical protein
MIVFIAVAFIAVALVALGVVRVQRYPGGLVVGHVAIRGRGVFFDREPNRFRVQISFVRYAPSHLLWHPPPENGPPGPGLREPRRPPPRPGPLEGGARIGE